MKIKLTNICWVDKNGNDICHDDMRLKGLPGSFVLELGDYEAIRLNEAGELRNVCMAIMDGLFKSRGARVEMLDVVYPGDSEPEAATWTTEMMELPAPAPRMAWLDGARGRYLVNIDAIAAISFNGDGSGYMYLKGSEALLAFQPGGADRIVSMMDVEDEKDAND